MKSPRFLDAAQRSETPFSAGLLGRAGLRARLPPKCKSRAVRSLRAQSRAARAAPRRPPISPLGGPRTKQVLHDERPGDGAGCLCLPVNALEKSESSGPASEEPLGPSQALAPPGRVAPNRGARWAEPMGWRGQPGRCQLSHQFAAPALQDAAGRAGAFLQPESSFRPHAGTWGLCDLGRLTPAF